MLEIRPSCEHCGKALPPNSEEALICSFECTFCKDCVENILHNVCPNCGGGLQLRPIRPTEKLVKESNNRREKMAISLGLKTFAPLKIYKVKACVDNDLM